MLFVDAQMQRNILCYEVVVMFGAYLTPEMGIRGPNLAYWGGVIWIESAPQPSYNA